MSSRPSSSSSSLGGLSGQESAKRAVWYGIVGMALAVFATLIGPGSGLWPLSLVLIAGGGVIGYYVAKRVQMTEMPQLVAAMHSLVGLAAVFVGFNAHIELVRVLAMDDDGAQGARRLRRAARQEDRGRASPSCGSSCSSACSSARSPSPARSSPTASWPARSPRPPIKLPGGHVLNAGAAVVSVRPADHVPQRRRRLWTLDPDDAAGASSSATT